jgi:isopentenyl-diphosphate delta-isomerase type 1
MEYITGSKQVTLVDERDQVIGAEDIFVAHQYPTQRHRASSVWLFRRNRDNQLEVLLQKRSEFKPLGAGWWGNAICGNVKPEETYLACAHRRLKEEIKVEQVELKEVYKFEYQAYGNAKYGEHEIDQVFIGNYLLTPSPNPLEVSEVGWTSWSELVAKVKLAAAGSLLTDPRVTLKYEVIDLKELTPSLNFACQFNGQARPQEIILSPWTAMMILDPRLPAAA